MPSLKKLAIDEDTCLSWEEVYSLASSFFSASTNVGTNHVQVTLRQVTVLDEHNTSLTIETLQSVYTLPFPVNDFR